MKIPLSEQIEEAERHRDEMRSAVGNNIEPRSSLDRAEGIVLTLHFLKTYEADFRLFMAQRDRSQT